MINYNFGLGTVTIFLKLTYRRAELKESKVKHTQKF